MSQLSRTAHKLIREKSLAMPRHLIFYDTETKSIELPNGSSKQVLKLGWAVYYRKSYGRHLVVEDWHSFTTADSFWQFVFSHVERKQKLWLIARNINFDFTVLKSWHYLRPEGYRLKFFYNHELTTVISVRSKKGSILFCDSLNWFDESIKETGERIGLPKLDIDFETCSDAELSLYCHRDVEIDFENFKQFIAFLEKYQISRLRYTIGSTAMSAFLFQSVDVNIFIHNNKEAVDLERESYRGGRTECFFIGEKNDDNYYVLDVNSLYPFVMSEHLYPVKYKAIHNQFNRVSLRESLQKYSVIARVLIETDEPVYAVPRDRTIFPIGTFWVTLTTPELKYALDAGHIVKVEDIVVYEQDNIFSKYVQKLYGFRSKFRDKGDITYSEICKKLLNSLYGKFAQKADVWQKIGEAPDEPDRVETCYRQGFNMPSSIRYLLGEIFELVGYEEPFNSFPAIASHVTAYGRLFLYELMKEVGYGNYFYCDTDSLIVNTVGRQRLENRIDNVKLGYLKVDKSVKSLVIRGLKDYSVGDKQVIKGIKKDAVKITEGMYEQSFWPTIRGLLRRRSPDTYIIGKTIKVLDRKYSKGEVTGDGSVIPYVLDESGLPF